MKINLAALNYYHFRRSMIALFCLGLLLPIVYILTLEQAEPIYLRNIFMPILISWGVILCLSFLRKVTLGTLIAHDVDFRTLYNLEKREDKPRHKNYNLKLQSDMSFFNGDFDNVILYSTEIIENANEEDAYNARHLQILSFFILKEFDKALDLICVQKKTIGIDSNTLEICNNYYFFIESFIAKKFSIAIEFLSSILVLKDTEKLNNRKVIVYYLLMLTYIELNDSEQIKDCERKIIASDIHNLTFFSRYIQ